jgi:RNA polymerase sigma-70 factor (ECF subfamily)
MGSDVSAKDDGLSAFEKTRPRLFGIAYRMLGSAAEAEDVVQDVWTRWQSTDRGGVRDPPAFLATTTTRLAINVLQSARARRETYVGPWLPEPVDTRADPALGAERGEALELAVLTLLERLSATERAAYVLREAFGYDYKEIADVIHVEEANARQLVTRARQHVMDGQRARVSNAEQTRLLQAFIAAAQTGDVAELERLFAADVVSKADGGGFIRAAQTPVVGRARVAKYIAAIAVWAWSGLTITVSEANGRASGLASRAGKLALFFTIDASPEGIDEILWILRPSKLTGVARTSSPRASTDTAERKPGPQGT